MRRNGENIRQVARSREGKEVKCYVGQGSESEAGQYLI